MAALPAKGDELRGFTVTETGKIEMLEARTVGLFHSHSGLRLLFIQNDDRELGFNLIYRTPQEDETDASHILEHLLLCSSRRYPSRDIFFDMDSKSYSTFMNGITDNTYTCYPICSQSQDQLMKLADVVLSCMEDPDALREPYFFKREGLRLELEKEEEPLTLHGTVLSEDWGHLTDIQENADSFMAQALYPNQISSRLLGRLHCHYKELTFSRVKEVYERYYHYDNCLMILYGNADLDTFLAFLDQEHLSKAPAGAGGTSPRIFKEKSRSDSCRQILRKSPAYEGSPVEQEAVLDYGLDLSEAGEEDLIFWDLLADFLNNDGSLWFDQARKLGINHMMEAYVDTLLPCPSLRFRLRSGDPCLADSFLESIRRTLTLLNQGGADAGLLAASRKENRISDLLTREAPHLGFSISEEIGHYWSVTGQTDYFTLYERAFDRFYGKEGQAIIRRLAGEALKPKTDALVITVPEPGMAERLEEEKEQWLEERLLSMTSEERQALIRDTEDFRQWNSRSFSNMDFLIHPSALPEPPGAPRILFREAEGIQLLGTGTDDCEGSENPSDSREMLGAYQIYFDIGSISPENRHYLTVYQMLLTELDTDSYTTARQKQLEQEYLHNCTFDEVYPEPEAGPNSRPMLSVAWNGLTEDFGNSLAFLLELMGNAHYDDRDTLIRVLEKYLPDYDLSKGEHASSLAFSMAESRIRRDAAFRSLLNSQETYYFLREMLERLQNDPAFGSVVSEKLKETAAAVLNRSKLIFLTAAPDCTLDEIHREAVGQLAALPEADEQLAALPDADGQSAALPDADGQPADLPAHNDNKAACDWTSLFPSGPGITGICTDAPSQEIRMIGDFKGDSSFKGRYLPFLLAAGDQYIKPALRYQGGAYDGGLDFYITSSFFSLWSTADPQISSTLSVFRQTGEMLARLPLTEEDLKGYILSAYSQALPPCGRLNSRMRYMRRRIMGLDTDQLNEVILDIRRASLKDQKDAAAFLSRALAQAPAAVAGNEHTILKLREEFDEIIPAKA